MSELSSAMRLPNEVLDCIFKHVERPHDLTTAALVSKRWSRAVTRCLYASVVLSEEDEPILFCETVHIHNPFVIPHVQDICIYQVSIPRLVRERFLTTPWPRLKTFDISVWSKEWQREIEGMAVFPELLSLRLDARDEEEPQRGKQLAPSDYMSSRFQSKLPRFPKLQTLELEHVDLTYAEPNGMLSFLMGACPHITTLEIHNWNVNEFPFSGDTGVLYLLRHVSPTLQSLIMSECCENFDAATYQVIQDLPRLSSLNFQIMGDFRFPIPCPATLENLMFSFDEMEAELLRTFLSQLAQGQVLPRIKSVPKMEVLAVTGHDESRRRCKEEIGRTWDALYNKGIAREPYSSASFFGIWNPARWAD